MKTTKRTINRVIVAVCAAAMLLTVGSWTAFAAGATLLENEAVWGNPVVIQKLDNGLEKRFYRTDNTMKIGFRYFVYGEGRVIDDGLTNIVPEMNKAKKQGLPVSELSQGYYQSHPTTAGEIDRAWGKPVAVRKLEGGLEERYYNTDNTMKIGFRYFLLKSGKVVDGGMSNVTGLPEPEKELKGVPMYSVLETGTQTVAEVESVWGKPVGVEKLANGMEERYYRIDNTMKIGNEMFLFKEGKAVGTTVATFQDLQSGEKSFDTALEHADVVQSIAIANQMKESEKEVKSLVNSQEVVFEFPSGKVKKIRLPEEKMMVAVAPYKHETHVCATHYISSCQAELVQQTFLVKAVDQGGNVLVDQPMTTLRNGFFELWLPRNRTIMLSVQEGDLRAEGEIDTFSNSKTCVTTLHLL
jgi:hypothetical protein